MKKRIISIITILSLLSISISAAIPVNANSDDFTQEEPMIILSSSMKDDDMDYVDEEDNAEIEVTNTIKREKADDDINAADDSEPMFRLFSADGIGIYTVQVSTYLKVRTGPGTEYSESGNVLYNGDIAYVYEVSGSWGKIYIDGYERWISLNYATRTGPLSPCGYTIYSNTSSIFAGETVDIWYESAYGIECSATLVVYYNGSHQGDYDIGTEKKQNITINEAGKWEFYLILKNESGTFNGVGSTGWRTIIVYNKISFDANGGSGAPSYQTKEYNQNITVSSTIPTRFGYTFLGWATSSSSSSATYMPNGSYSDNKSITLYAVWDTNNTLSTPPLNTYGTVSVAGTMRYWTFTPSESGTYVFESVGSDDTYGYLYNSNGTQIAYDDNSGENSNFSISYNLTAGNKYYYAAKFYSATKTGTIYAQLYKKQTYNVTYNYSYNGGSYVSKTSDTVLSGSTADLTPTATKSGWTFIGWNTNPDATIGLSSYTVNANTTLYAIYRKTLIARFYSRENSLQSTQATLIYNRATSGRVTAPAPASYSGWTVSGWRNNTTATLGIYKAGENIEIRSDTNYYATYSRSLMLSYNANGGSSTPSSQTATQYYNAYGNKESKSFTLASAISRSGYTFNKWAVGSASGTTYNAGGNISISDNTTMYAIWNSSPVVATPTLSVSNIIGGKSISISCATSGATIYYTTNGTTPTTSSTRYTESISLTTSGTNTIKAIAVASGYNNSSVASQTISLSKATTPISNYVTNSNLAYGANIVLSTGNYSNYKIYYTTDGSQPTLNSNEFNGNIAIQDDIELKAITAVSGYALSDVATFTYLIPKYTITFNANGGVGGPTKQTKKYGQDVSISNNKPQRTGFLFAGWGKTATDTVIAYRAGDTYKNEENISLYAIWTREDVKYPEVSVGDAENITESSAKLTAYINSDGGDTILNRYIVYFEKNNPNAKYEISTSENFVANISNLKEGTEYWYYATANNSRGYGSSVYGKFTTLSKTNSKPSSLTISPKSITINPGVTVKLSTQVLPTTALNKNIVWRSSDSNVVKVSSDGSITGVSDGMAIITATTEVNRLSQNCTVTVSTNQVSVDLSEWNLVTNTSDKSPIGWNLSTAASDRKGGNIQRAMSYLTRWSGPFAESDDVYPIGNDGDYKELKNPLYHIQDAVFIPKNPDSSPLDNSGIKDAVLKYGGVHTSFYSHGSRYDGTKTNYYNDGTIQDGGHAVVIIGWDDNYSAEHFKYKPPGDGAFICKNSYGVEQGENGYFYISYYDYGIRKKDFSVAYSGIESTDNYDRIYQYDPLGPTASQTFNAGQSLYCANVFPSEADKGLEHQEELSAVGFYTKNQGMRCQIFIVSDYEKKEDLVNLHNPEIDQIIKDAGYHTIKLDKPITINRGSRFAVVLRVYDEKGASQYIERPIKGKYYEKANGNRNESFYSADGIFWQDFNDNPDFISTNACIKAFTNVNGLQAYSINAIDNENREYAIDRVYTIDEVVEIGDDVNEEFVETLSNVQLMSTGNTDELDEELPMSINVGSDVDYLDGAEYPEKYDMRDYKLVTPVKNQGQFFNCWAFATIGALESSILKKMTESIGGSGLDGGDYDNTKLNEIRFATDDIMIAKGNDQQLNIVTKPVAIDAQISYSTSDEDVVIVDTGGKMTAVGIGKAIITASCGELTAKCNVVVTTGSSAQSIMLSEQSIDDIKGKVILLDYNIYPMDTKNKNVKWISSDESVCTVNENGVVTLKSVGIAEVTAITADGGKTSTCEITVRDDNLPCTIAVEKKGLTKYKNNLYGMIDIKLNSHSAEYTGDLYVAIYDDNDALISIKKQSVTATKNSSIYTFEFDINDTEFNTGEIKVFYWNEHSLEPLATAISDVAYEK